MIFNGNKFNKGDESASNSVSPSRKAGEKPKKSPKIKNENGTSMISASSGKFSLRGAFGANNETAKGEPLELM
jgi:hypothetical protein